MSDLGQTEEKFVFTHVKKIENITKVGNQKE